ncbi:hypothetical protein Tco_0728835, partial [Tanacetum coccineum]
MFSIVCFSGGCVLEPLQIGISPMIGLAQYKPDHALIQMGDGFQAESAVHFLKVFEMNGKKQALVLFENEKQATKALVCKHATALGDSMIRICVLILLKMLSEYIDMNTVLPALSYEVSGLKSITAKLIRLDQDARYALFKLLQMGTMTEYENLLREMPKTLGETFALARITEARFEDERATTVIAKPNDLNIAVQVQDIEETTLHTSDKVKVVSTSMVATYEEHGCQDEFCMVATYEEQECQDGLKPVTTRSSAGKKGDLGAITSKGVPPDHMRASEKELVVLKSPLEQTSMFRHQERMLRRQEQQRLAKDARIQRRFWDPGIKSIQDNTLRASITSLKCVLTQEHLDAICAKYFVPEEVHPQLPSSDATMHERPTGKVGMYTRFFDYANYRIPFSTFFVSILTHFRILFSQLSVFGSAKFGFTKRPNAHACYSKNLDYVKNWNDHFFWVDEFVVPANARFSWFLGSNIVKDRAPTPSEYKVGHVETLMAEASPFLGTVAKHRTVTLLPTSVVRPSGELSASVEREFVGDASVGGGGDEEVASVGGQGNVEPSVPITDDVGTEIPGPKRTKKKRVTRGSERTPAASHPPKRLRADYGTAGGSATGGKSPSVLNRLLQDSRLMVEQGVPALPTLPFITSSVTASPLEEGGDHTDSVTGPSLRTVGPSARFVVLSDSSHHSATNSAGPEGDSFVRSTAPVMTEATAVTTIATTVAIPADVGKDKSVPHPFVFGSSSSSENTDRTLSLFTERS